MKQIILSFIAIIACLVTVAAQVDTSAVQQSATDTRIEYTDSPDTNRNEKGNNADNHDFFSTFGPGPEIIIPIIAIVFGCGLPVAIVFIAFYFKYKNRKAKYKLAEQALAAGQPIPENFFQFKLERDTLQKGITNTFTGIGLFIFLWAVTEEFSIGTIGLLIMFMGLGQIVIYYAQNGKKENKKDRHNNDNNVSIEE